MAKTTTKKVTLSNVISVGSKQAISRLLDSAMNHQLIAVIGSGVSMSLTNGKYPFLSWKGLVQHGFDFCVTKGLITIAQAKQWEPQRNSNDIDDLLCAAELVSRKLGAPKGDLYLHWMQDVLRSVEPLNDEMSSALIALKDAKIPFCTLNYDLLLEMATGKPGLLMHEKEKVLSWLRKENTGILYLHGSCIEPETCILSIRDYETTIRDEYRDLVQRSLATINSLLFIGCGETFCDPNFASLIKWLREKINISMPKHYALVKNSEVPKYHADPAWHGFIEPVGYGAKYEDLPKFLLHTFPAIVPRSNANESYFPKTEVSDTAKDRIINDYLSFLVKDCGQMTIEGVRADMEIGQRKFDIEKLFVPLEVLRCPPDIPESDPKREEKLSQWQNKNSTPINFGKILKKNNRIALLALPGGGKTLLLKRLVVAYAQNDRRLAIKDDLPQLNVVPVLIRCREWRDYIQTPILSLIKKIPTIYGDPRLIGLSEALLPLFSAGRILLLVDGLDEIHIDAHRTTFVENLESFLEDYNLTRLVVTSREAGFRLVAPCISRFCIRWRIAPLNDKTISSLCDHWQRLMFGTSPLTIKEGKELARNLLNNHSLRRLAENPLLLTMLLVVKHGAGRLPPDRVSLYDRAVEVLLDTWNIKGHAPLNPKEAVPQLACVAYQMMKDGKQTATKKYLLNLLEEARDNVPQIRRYAKDNPDDFLKRVELRSSLLVEAGHQLENGQMVPFYQFRHLTFQEYLAAVAVVEGHNMEYSKDYTLLKPLSIYLLSDEWKEVIPMAAVLARKQAEPIIRSLVDEANILRDNVYATGRENLKSLMIFPSSGYLPLPVSRLVHCLSEEAEASTETLTQSLGLIVFFAYGCESSEEWTTICRGPYGKELLHQAWELYKLGYTEKNTRILHTYSYMAVFQHTYEYWFSEQGLLDISNLFNSLNIEDKARGLFTCIGVLFYARDLHLPQKKYSVYSKYSIEIEKILLGEDPTLYLASVFGLAIMWNRQRIDFNENPNVSEKVLDQLLRLRLTSINKDVAFWSSIAFSMQMGLPREIWKPKLTKEDALMIRESTERGDSDSLGNQSPYLYLGNLIIAFHSGEVWTEDELTAILNDKKKMPLIRKGVSKYINSMLVQMENKNP
jgi:hypothetical protein